MSDAQQEADGFQAESVATGLRGWLHDGVELLRVRLELLGLEARDHTTELVELTVLSVAAVLLVGGGLLFLSVLVTVLLWDSYRTLALSVFATLFLTAGAIAVYGALTRWQRQRRWFESSLRELKADVEQLKP